MDLKALMQKLETINTKQIVKESVETKKVITESVARRVVKESADPVFKGSIARSLAEEFGYDLDERVTINPDGTTSGGIAPPPKAAPAAGANPYQGADAAKFASMSPEDQAWLTKGGGKPDINDEFILRRAPNGGKPVTAPGSGAATKPAGTAGAPGAQDDATGVDDAVAAQLASQPLTTPPGAEPDEPQASTLAEPPADAGAEAGGSINPATLAQYKALLDKLKASQGGAGTKPTQIAPAPKPKPAQKTPIQPAVGVQGIKAGTPGAANQAQADALNLAAAGGMGAESIEYNDTAMTEGVRVGDEQILAIIKSIKY